MHIAVNRKENKNKNKEEQSRNRTMCVNMNRVDDNIIFLDLLYTFFAPIPFYCDFFLCSDFACNNITEQ